MSELVLLLKLLLVTLGGVAGRRTNGRAIITLMPAPRLSVGTWLRVSVPLRCCERHRQGSCVRAPIVLIVNISQLQMKAELPESKIVSCA